MGITFSWAAFEHRGNRNRDGWGFQYVADRSLLTRRFPTPLDECSEAAALIRPVQTRLFLAHVRHAVQGVVALENTQPFVDDTGRFGIVASMSRCRISARFRQDLRRELKGRTGTEILFRMLVRRLVGTGNCRRKEVILDVVADAFDRRQLPDKASGSFLLADRCMVYAFRHRKPLWIRTRRPPHDGIVRLRDPSQPDYRVDLSHEKGENETATVLATTPLTHEHWERLPDRALCCIDGGEVVWQEPVP